MTETLEGELALRDYVGWAIVDLLGHQRVAGWIQPAAVGGAHFVRIDVPTDQGASTQLLGPGSIYKITYCDEQAARQAARTIPAPISPYEVGASERETALLDSLWELARGVEAFLDAADRGSTNFQLLQEALERAQAALSSRGRKAPLVVAQVVADTGEGEVTFDSIPF